jgi:hypothetical protein
MGRAIMSAAVLTFLACPASARAGLYDLNAPRSARAVDPPFRQVGRPAPPDAVETWLTDLMLVHDQAPGASQPKPATLRAAYVSFVDDLERRRQETGLTTSEYATLGGCLLRMGRPAHALPLLEEGLRKATPADPARFLVLLNLANTYRTTPELMQRAIDTQRQVLAAWPTAWAGWGRDELAWTYRVEKFQLALWQQRQREILVPRRGDVGLDPLFARVRWVGSSGRYEPGALALDHWDELPADAEQVVLQLMLWDPHDARLFWLYGELLNARGQVPAALRVFTLCGDRGLGGAGDLRRHRAVLGNAVAIFKALGQPSPERQQLALALLPRGLPVPGGVGPALAEAIPPAALQAASQPNLGTIGVLQSVPVTPSSLPDWRVLLVGFAVGCLFGALGVFQWRQLRRRPHRPG